MQHIPQGVHEEGEGAEEDDEGDDAGVEQRLRRQHVRQLRQSTTMLINHASQDELLASACRNSTTFCKKRMREVPGQATHLGIQHREANGHGQVDPCLEEGDDLRSTSGRRHHQHILCMEALTLLQSVRLCVTLASEGWRLCLFARATAEILPEENRLNIGNALQHQDTCHSIPKCLIVDSMTWDGSGLTGAHGTSCTGTTSNHAAQESVLSPPLCHGEWCS